MMELTNLPIFTCFVTLSVAKGLKIKLLTKIGYEQQIYDVSLSPFGGWGKVIRVYILSSLCLNGGQNLNLVNTINLAVVQASSGPAFIQLKNHI